MEICQIFNIVIICLNYCACFDYCAIVFDVYGLELYLMCMVWISSAAFQN